MKKRIISFFMCCCAMLAVSACGVMPGTGGSEESADFSAGRGGTEIRILSGSENQELEEIIGDCADEAGVRVEIDYKGSVDIMRTLQDGAKEYDAVWPASSIWISMGDEQHLVKHSESISITPVVFGIRQSLARELGFTDGDVSVKEILDAISSGKMTFCMTSATQSNSGASAYIGFLYALLGKQDGLTEADLQDKQLQEEIRTPW